MVRYLPRFVVLTVMLGLVSAPVMASACGLHCLFGSPSGHATMSDMAAVAQADAHHAHHASTAHAASPTDTTPGPDVVDTASDGDNSGCDMSCALSVVPAAERPSDTVMATATDRFLPFSSLLFSMAFPAEIRPPIL